jgi:hypothetical protein
MRCACFFICSKRLKLLLSPAVLFLAWAFAPEAALRGAGVSYYPAKWWALAAPAWLCAAVLYGYTAYGRRARPLQSRTCIHAVLLCWPR